MTIARRLWHPSIRACAVASQHAQHSRWLRQFCTQASGSGSGTHWLDKYMPGVKAWLDEQVLEAWVKAVQDRCRAHAALQDVDQDGLLRSLRAECGAVAARHEDKAVDGRAQTHVAVAAMVLGTHKVLLPYVRNEPEVIDMLMEQNGSKGSDGIRMVSKFGFWFKQNLLRQAPLDQVAQMQRGMMRDLGAGFEADCSVDRDVGSCQLTISRCLYHTILAEEGKLHLLRVCCCSQDASWFDSLQSQGLRYERPTWMGDGDECCQLRVCEAHAQAS